MQTAIFAGGCFWCTEAVFLPLKGVSKVVSGYIGGDPAMANYDAVCTGRSGHAEAVRISFDANLVSYDTLLDVFFNTHDPTQLNRQGNDVGTQYRSGVYYLNDAQKSAADDAKERAAGIWGNRVVTEIEPATEFFAAEDYHQDYFNRNPGQPYCAAVVAPKVSKARQNYADLMA
ncbi:MAG: peptide-methionine (S)-S-oxide reductase MsrA [Pseudomonadota bacterium]